MKDFLISGVVSWTVGRNLSFSSLEKEVLYFLVFCAASALETTLATSANSSSGEKESWLESEPKGLPDILLDKGGKVLVEEVGKGGEDCIRVE